MCPYVICYEETANGKEQKICATFKGIKQNVSCLKKAKMIRKFLHNLALQTVSSNVHIGQYEVYEKREIVSPFQTSKWGWKRLTVAVLETSKAAWVHEKPIDGTVSTPRCRSKIIFQINLVLILYRATLTTHRS